MFVKEIMKEDVVTIDRHRTIVEACNKYRDYRVGCLIVTDDKQCMGIVTERDIIEKTICMNRDPEETSIEEIMSTNLKTIHPSDKVEKALEIMNEYKIKNLNNSKIYWKYYTEN